MTKADYESMTVAELKEMAEFQGIPIPSDARKADIIEALQALEAEGKEGIEEIPPGPEPIPEPVTNEQQMSSTVTHEIADLHFAKIKLSV